MSSTAGESSEAVPETARRLGLEPHPEGGWFARTWTSPVSVETAGGIRPGATLIHYLVEPGQASAWHVVVSDEIWLWHGPGTLTLQFGGDGDEPSPGATVLLGAPSAPHGSGRQGSAQVLIPGGVWQRTLPAQQETLVSCLVSPGFSFDDWKLAE